MVFIWFPAPILIVYREGHHPIVASWGSTEHGKNKVLKTKQNKGIEKIKQKYSKKNKKKQVLEKNKSIEKQWKYWKFDILIVYLESTNKYLKGVSFSKTSLSRDEKQVDQS